MHCNYSWVTSKSVFIITNKSSMNIRVHIFVCGHKFPFFWNKFSELWFLDHTVTTLSIERNCQILFQVAVPFCIPTIPHLNTKNFPSISRGLQPSWTVAAGREVPNRAVRMGLIKSQGIDKQHFCWPIVRKRVECRKKTQSSAIRITSKAASLPRWLTGSTEIVSDGQQDVSGLSWSSLQWVNAWANSLLSSIPQ